ncbi:MAG: glycosyltransferase family protein, partial [Myxococcales bacterium]|nr:glycosyltransferase family protein [Myxococcales bacterium]
VVVQARASSTRLPGKIFMDLGGAPLLVRMLERLKACKTPFTLVVATTDDPADDQIPALAAQASVACVRGHPTDLLERHLTAARAFSADAVAKIPSDCPLIDPRVVDRILGTFVEANGAYEYVSNLHPATWPDGYDVEVMSMDALERAGREATRPHEREHTTPYLWDEQGRFRCHNVAWDRDLSMTHRLTIDYAEDYALIKAVYEALYRPEGEAFSLDQILALLDARPDLYALNAHLSGVNWYRHHLDELQTIDVSRTRWTAAEQAQGGAR